MSFTSAGEEIVQATKVGLYKAAIEIMYESQRIVPVDTATLKGSAQVQEPEHVGDRISVTLGYGYGVQVNPKTGQIAAQYAVPVHERLDQYHAPPTQAKYLEQPVLEFIPRFGETIAASISRWTRGGRGLEMTPEALTPGSGFLP